MSAEPKAAPFLRPYVGSREYLNGGDRWILALQKATPAELKELPKTVERMRAVKAFRAKSKRKSTLAIASYPERYNVEVLPTSPFLVVPEVSSERRHYVPIGWMEPPTIPSNLVRIINSDSKPLFGLLTSAMHMSWLRYIGGRLKSDYRYSIGLVYNTFPMPSASEKDLEKLAPLVDALLAARTAFPDSALATLYDPDFMPASLRKAHLVLDRAVDRLYRTQAFNSDRERAEYLFGLYEKMVSPVIAAASAPKGRRRAAK